MKVHAHTWTHTHGETELLEGFLFPHSLSHTPTRHHVSVLGILLSPPSPEYDMALGLHLSCIHTVSLAVQDIWQTKSSSISNVWQMKITKAPHGDSLCGTCLRYGEKLFLLSSDIVISQCENISFQNDFSLLLLNHQTTEGKQLRVSTQAGRNLSPFTVSKPFWCSFGTAGWIFWCAVCAPWCGEPFLGCVFHKYPPLWRPFWSQTI